MGKSLFLQTTGRQLLANRQPPLTPPKGELGLPVRPLLLCNGAAIALQRRPRCNMTACSLQPRGGPVARRNPLFDLKIAIKNSRIFVKFESRKGLPASQAPPLGESEGAFWGSRRRSLVTIRPLLLIKTQIFKHFSEHDFVNIYQTSNYTPTPTKVLQNPHGRDIFLYLSASNVLILIIFLADKYKNMSLPCAFCNTFGSDML